MRIGHGYDVHRFASERKFILGGVEIPCEYGLLGHSDADVLIHAICDALLGAAALGDIGKHFPDSDPKFCGIDSRIILKSTVELVKNKGYKISNIDSTVIAQRPKIAPYAEQMRSNIAEDIGIDISRVNIKATTEEGLGFTGALEGVSAHAVCILDE
ncbi:MAG: 2-C-methyl-D-erythritol 2,4-cyclodiphosphate synthase [Clostridia bacterium]|nr:2-C-methyl-D-erythritol 2,4-cyclodiphosphate synthase [Clostridia bacterium]